MSRHAMDVLEMLPNLGLVDPDTVPKLVRHVSAEELRIKKARAELPVPSVALNLDDIEVSPLLTLFFQTSGTSPFNFPYDSSLSRYLFG